MTRRPGQAENTGKGLPRRGLVLKEFRTETYNLFPATDPSLRVRCSNGRGEKNEATKENRAHPDFSRLAWR